MRTENKTTDQILNIDFFPYAVEKSLKQLTPTSSTDPVGIPDMLLKHCATSLAVPLSHTFDTSFKDGVLPAEWTIANNMVLFVNVVLVQIFSKACMIGV